MGIVNTGTSLIIQLPTWLWAILGLLLLLGLLNMFKRGGRF